MMKPQKTQCIKHILEFYIGNRKGVATVHLILKYPIQLVQIKCKVTRMHFIKILQFAQDPIKYLLQSMKISIVHMHVTLCVKHESTTNITIGHNTIGRLYSSSNASLLHTITCFSYQSQQMRRQTTIL